MRCTTPEPKRLQFFDLPFILLMLPLMLALVLGCESKPGPKPEADPQPSMSQTPRSSSYALELEPEALNILERGLNSLSSQGNFHMTTQQTLEDVIDNQVRIDYEIAADLTVSRPDKIRVERHGSELHQLLFYDGEVFTLHNPQDKVYASEALKGTIEDMFHMVRDTFGISASAADLIYPNAFELLTQNAKGAQILGKEMIGEISCDHVLVRLPEVSYQIWISDAEPYLPHKYVVTDTSTPHLLSYSTLMTSWDLNPEISESMFKHVPSADAHQIYFIKMSESVEKSTD